MFWLDIFLSLRVCRRQAWQSQCRYGKFVNPRERHIWPQVRILYENDKVALIDNGMKIWVPKLQIYRIRLRNNTFEFMSKKALLDSA